MQVHVALEKSLISGDIFRGPKNGPHCAKETGNLRTPPVSGSWSQQVQQNDSKQGPFQFQLTHPHLTHLSKSQSSFGRHALLNIICKVLLRRHAQRHFLIKGLCNRRYLKQWDIYLKVPLRLGRKVGEKLHKHYAMLFPH